MDEILCCLAIFLMVVYRLFCLTEIPRMICTQRTTKDSRQCTKGSRRTVLPKLYNKVGRITLLKTLTLVLAWILR